MKAFRISPVIYYTTSTCSTGCVLTSLTTGNEVQKKSKYLGAQDSSTNWLIQYRLKKHQNDSGLQFCVCGWGRKGELKWNLSCSSLIWKCPGDLAEELKLAVTTVCLFKLGRCSYPGSTPFPFVSILEVNLLQAEHTGYKEPLKLNKLYT